MVRYLNQSGTRVVTDEKILVTGIHNGKTYHRMRKPLYWEQCGNFVRCCVKVGSSVYLGATYDKDGVCTLDIMKCGRIR
jgi:hypothetical protein